MNIDDIYTSLSDAEIEIKRRHQDLDLKKKLDSFWAENRPNFIHDDSPRSVFSKSVITPNLELKYFLDVSKDIGIKTYLWEYGNGKFVGKNSEKRHLGKIFFHNGHGKNNGHKIHHLNIVDFNKQEGKIISEVETLHNKKLMHFHREMLKKRFPDEDFRIKDISEWFDKTRHLDHYYVYYLSLFIRDHILFENFLFDEKEESKFTLDKFLPSFEKVTKLFGVKPLIVPLLPHEHEKSHLWFMYDKKVQDHVDGML
jgi:hypothetical protein